MKLVTLVSTLLSGIVTQPYEGTAMWVAETSPVADSSSQSSLLANHGTQKLSVISPTSQSACSSAGVWAFHHKWATRRLCSSNLPRTSDNPWLSGSATHDKIDIATEIAIWNSNNVCSCQYDASSRMWNGSLPRPGAGYDVRSICNSNHNGLREDLAEGYPNVITSEVVWTNERGSYSHRDDQTYSQKALGHFPQLVRRSTQNIDCAAEDCNGTGSKGRQVTFHHWRNDKRSLDNGVQYSYQTTVQDVNIQVNYSSGLNKVKAVQCTNATDEHPARSTSISIPTQKAQTTLSAPDTNQDRLVSSQKGQLGLVIFFAFACALL